MDFKLSEEQELIRENIRELVKKYLDPIAVEIDESSRYPAEVIEQLAAGGWMGMPYPVEYGGAGLDYVSYAMVIEEISRSCAATGFTVSCHTSLASGPIFNFGNEEQKQKYLVPLAKGQHIGAFAVTEPGAGTDVGAATTTATLDGDSYVLNGIKTFTSNGPVADTFVVFAFTDKSLGGKGMSAFIISKDNPGLKVGQHFYKMGIRASQTSEIILKDCRVPREDLLGKEGQGLQIAMSSFDHGRIGIAAQAVGITQAALDESISYSKQRVQFGKPISKNQAIQWMIADMATDIAAARFLYSYAAFLKDQKQPFSKEAAMAKVFAAEMSTRHTSKAVQIHGGYGYIKGQKVERLMRDAKITEIYEGTSEAQRMVIAGNLLR
ncbi:acyl-CoA dehydrogenase [Syntrophomonas wolfei]|uniref:Butyryl-CoA dehydrogenase n=1 Tax=Syntrophomonas wolfei subsp. wolfei (strain DSM 2245B / Goettingen) TaxID=335541 RepID=Q0B088_SYNWW|nr:acyl-CoA dehydrogenase [Syntrophomonas wolfei]ABI67616.1 butyryl-CoA dehydrogenase [Syntrophomonas wolfei subsp. wolfei str. Goettingen G311]